MLHLFEQPLRIMLHTDELREIIELVVSGGVQIGFEFIKSVLPDYCVFVVSSGDEPLNGSDEVLGVRPATASTAAFMSEPSIFLM